ncbi:MAG: YbhB/YbcL family Raf kinase inhibitor-like protein [Bryobacteraceae bacterium]|nr:YbhB/YbcL family Raf kinase inhibitor-like protein [Bryobacteraceae bacterium]
MKITSEAFEDHGSIPAEYTCDGRRVNPPLSFEDVPRDAQSLVLIMDDIDASHMPDSIWNHWLLWNIAPETKGIAAAVGTPPGVNGHSTGGELEYQGPCPPEGEHRYVFRLFALDRELHLDVEATRRPSLLKAMEGCILARAELTGRYARTLARGDAENGVPVETQELV